jgi:hypothetical protein
MGSDCTASALENRFRSIKQDGKRINDALSNGVDPLSLNIGSREGTNTRSRCDFPPCEVATQDYTYITHCPYSFHLFHSYVDILCQLSIGI